MAMEEIISEGLRLGAHFARPPGTARVPALLVLPGFPRGPGGAATVGNTDQTLCDRIAREAGWAGLTFTFRGTGPSEGDFSIEGWLADVRAAVDALHARPDITGVWIAGFRLGGTLAIVTAASDDRVRGIATFAAPGVARNVGARSGMVPRVRASHRCAAHRRLSLRPDGWIRAIANLDPVDGRRRRSRRGRGCSCTAAPTTSCRRRRALAGRCRERLRRGPDRRERPAPAPSRPARDRRRCSAGSTVRNPEAARAAHVGEHGGERVGERELGPPAGCGAQLGCVADNTGTSTGRTRPGSSSMRSGVWAWASEIGPRSSAIATPFTAADVVDLAGRAVASSAAVRRARRRARR